MTSRETDDLVALHRLQSSYADIVSRRAWAELSSIFFEDTRVHVDTVTAPVRILTGPAEFSAFVASALERFDHFVFAVLNATVELVDDTHATGRMFMSEIRHVRESDSWPTAHGVYQDRYRKEDGRWRFAERHYRSMARLGPDGAVFGLPPSLEP